VTVPSTQQATATMSNILLLEKQQSAGGNIGK